MPPCTMNTPRPCPPLPSSADLSTHFNTMLAWYLPASTPDMQRATPRQSTGHPIAMGWQGHVARMRTAWWWVGNGIALGWHWGGTGALGWRWDVSGMTMGWRWNGDGAGMAFRWPWDGSGMAME